MAKFVLTAQLRLQAPNNVRKIVNDIQRQLNGVKVDIDVNTKQSVSNIDKVTKAADRAASAAENMGNTFGVSLKRFAAFSLASRAIGLFSTKIAAAIDDAIEFQNEMVRLSQVTGDSLQKLSKVTDQITKLSTGLGVSSREILSVTTILAQAGIQADDLTVAINTLAKTALAPTFGDIQDTAEGAVAVIAQFGEGVGALEKQLGAINKVSALFAVESEDLISVIRRTGGVFKASGGDLNELLALFTSVRATTRESAESIATGLRTIFTRIQRPATIEYLKQFGVQLTDLNGKFVGPYEAVRQLSTALAGLGEGDVRFIQVAEELGGFRQIGKVIPLLRQFEVAEKARQAAIAGGDSLNEDVITAQQSIAVQITKVREEFLALIRAISDTTTFKVLVKTSLDFASALIKIADAIKPLIPLIGTFATIKFASNIGGFLSGLGSGFAKTVGTKQYGGVIHKFASGGLVPGSGNRDTVPAMLSPGEFVIRKSSVNKIGAGNLANINKYATGGPVKAVLKNDVVGGLFLQQGSGGNRGINKPINLEKGKELGNGFPSNVRQVSGDIYIGLLKDTASASLQSEIAPRLSEAIQNASAVVMKSLEIDPFDIDETKASKDAVNKIDLKSIEGFVFEAFISALSGLNLSDAGATFDFTNVTDKGKKRLANLFTSPVEGRLLDAKRTLNSESVQSGDRSIANKVLASMKNGLLSPSDFTFEKADANLGQKAKTTKLTPKRVVKKATGGKAPSSDTVPALLTPGEFVINKKSAQNIGYGNLHRMNKHGVSGFAKGGPVKFSGGGPATSSGGGPATSSFGGFDPVSIGLATLPSIISNFAGATEDSSNSMQRLVANISGLITTFGVLQLAAAQLGVKLSAKNIFGTGQGGLGDIIGGFRKNGRNSSETFSGNFRNFGNGPLASKLTTPSSLFGKAGQFLGQTASRGGIAGKIAGVAGRGLSSLGGGAIGTLFSGLAKFAGPIGAVITGFTVLNSVIDSFTGYSIEAEKAIKEGNAARAAEYSVLANAPAMLSFIPIIGKDLAESWINISSAFGGKSLDYIKANAEAQAYSAKFQKEYGDNAKTASKALEDIASGLRSSDEALRSGDLTKNLNNILNQINSYGQVIAANEAQKSGGVTGAIRNVLSAVTFGYVQSSGQRNTEIDKENEKIRANSADLLNKEVEEVTSRLKPLATNFFLAGKSAKDFEQYLKETNAVDFKKFLAFGSEGKKALDNLTQAWKNQEKAVAENIAFYEALNLGLRDTNANIQANNSRLKALVESQDGYNREEQALNVLTTAISESASALDPSDVKIAQTELANVLSSYGASSRDIDKAVGSTELLYKAQSQASKIFADTINKNKGVLTPQDFQSAFQKNLIDSLQVGDDEKKRLMDIFRNIKLDETDLEAIFGGNFSGALSKMLDPLEQAVTKDLSGAMKVAAENRKILNDLEKQAINVQKEAIESRKQSIEIELEARQYFQDFGGPIVTATDKLNSLNRQLEADLSLTNLGGVGAGSASDLRNVGQRIAQGISEIQNRRMASMTGSGNFSGISPADATREQNLKDTQKQLLDNTRARIKLIQEEINIAEKKNALEKSAFEKLLSGDIAGFIEDQAASAAAKALTSGNTGLAKMLGPQAILGGLKSLEGTGLSSAQQLAAAKTAGTAVGASERLAQAFSGTTPELMALKQEGQQLASVLNSVGQSIARTDEMSVQAQQVLLSVANRNGAIAIANALNNPAVTPVTATNQIAKTSNSVSAVNRGSAGSASSGGQVYNNAVSTDTVGALNTAINNFTAAIDKLQGMKLNVKLDPTNVNVNFNNTSFLSNLSNEMRNMVLDLVVNHIKLDTDGTLRKKPGIVS